MDDLGGKLRTLRLAKELTGSQMAVRVLGKLATKEKRRDFANYLSRLERGVETNPSLTKLEELAIGFGCVDLVTFLVQLQNPSLKGPSGTGQNPPSIEVGAHGDLVSAVVPKVLYELSDQLLKAAERALADQPVPSPRVAKSERRRSRA